MTISQKSHKAYLLGLFYIETPTGRRERTFPLDQLVAASSVMRKLKSDSAPVLSDGGVIGFQFGDGDIDFSIDEAKLLKDLVAGVREATPTDFAVIEELRDVLA